MSHPDFIDRIDEAADRMASADRICCLTGAGISAESGVPTFRGVGGDAYCSHAPSVRTLTPARLAVHSFE